MFERGSLSSAMMQMGLINAKRLMRMEFELRSLQRFETETISREFSVESRGGSARMRACALVTVARHRIEIDRSGTIPCIDAIEPLVYEHVRSISYTRREETVPLNI